MPNDKIMEIDEEELAKIKTMIYKGKSTICWFLTRDQVKGLIALAELSFTRLDILREHDEA